jgi:DNA-directed RNA polymerase subunit K/omega
MFEDQQKFEDEETTEEPRIPEEDLQTPGNKYELVMAAAKEAERLNAVYRHRHEKPPTKVTIMAVDRVRPGITKFIYEEDETEEPGEQLPYFNPEL